MDVVSENHEDLLPFLQEVEVSLLRADFIAPTSGWFTYYFKPGRPKLPQRSAVNAAKTFRARQCIQAGRFGNNEGMRSAAKSLNNRTGLAM
jgi:hypothetical protein